MPCLWPRALIVLLVAALWASAALAAANFPPLTGTGGGPANILSPVTVADLERKLADLEQKSGIQLVVATVPSLGGDEIEPYANALFRAWKLGEAKKNNGVLLLVAPKERRVRIEVGYGLEGTLTDAVSSIIISNAIAPRFRAGDFNGGVTRGVDDIITALTTDAAEWKPRPTDMRAEPEASLLDTLAPFLIFLFIMFVISRDEPARRRRQCHLHPDGHGRRVWPRGIWRRLWRRGRLWRRRLLRRRRLVGRRRRLGRLVMILDPDATARVEAAYDAAQLKTRAPLVCVLAGASTSCDAEFLLGACILALATPLPLLLFTDLSAHRIYVAQLLVAILAAVLASLPPLRRWLYPEARGALGRPPGGAGAVRPARDRPLAMRRADLRVARRALHTHRSGRGRRAGDRPRPMASRGRRSAWAARRRGDGNRPHRTGRALRRASRKTVPAWPSGKSGPAAFPHRLSRLAKGLRRANNLGCWESPHREPERAA